MLDQNKLDTLAAVAARFLPSDDGVGAAETGVAEFLGQALAHPMYSVLLYPIAGWLDGLSAQALERYGQPFQACEPAQQDAVLKTARENPDPFQRLIFDTLVALTVEGFLSDPVHGGNKDGAGWRFVGYETEEPRGGFCTDPRGRS